MHTLYYDNQGSHAPRYQLHLLDSREKGIEGTWSFVSVVVAADVDEDGVLEARRNGNVMTMKPTTAQATIR